MACSIRRGLASSRLSSLGAALAVIGTADAAAGDWRTRLTFNQSLTARSEAGDGGDAGESLRATTSLGLTTTGQTARSSFSFSPSLRLLARSNATGDEEPLSPSIAFSGAVTHRQSARLSLNGSLSVTPEFVSDREFDRVLSIDPETGLTETTTVAREVDPLQITIVGRVGASLRISATDAVQLGFFARTREFDETSDEFQPSRSFGGSLGVSRALSPRTSVSLSTGLTQFVSEAADAADTTSLRGSLGVSRRFTSRHAASLSLGATATDNGEDTNVGFTGGASLSYAGRDGSASLGLNQQLSQNDDGRVSSVLQLRANASRRINNVSSISAGLRVATSNPVFEDEENTETTFTFSPRYQLQLTDAWRLTATYGLSVNADDIENDVDNRFTIAIGRSFDITN